MTASAVVNARQVRERLTGANRYRDWVEAHERPDLTVSKTRQSRRTPGNNRARARVKAALKRCIASLPAGWPLDEQALKPALYRGSFKANRHPLLRLLAARLWRERRATARQAVR